MPADRSHKSDQSATERRSPQRDSAAAPTPAHPLLRLQQQVGNRQVARMLAQQQPALQREAEEEEELQAQRDPALLQRQADAPEVGLEGGPVSDGVASRIRAKRGGGSPLGDGTRSSMEGAFGSDFSSVRVHTDGESAALSRSIGAKAFTTGNDIFFGKDATPGDSALLSHELTHVVQQGGSSAGSGAMTVSAAGDSHEREADAMSSAVTSGAAQRKRDEE